MRFGPSRLNIGNAALAVLAAQLIANLPRNKKTVGAGSVPAPTGKLFLANADRNRSTLAALRLEVLRLAIDGVVVLLGTVVRHHAGPLQILANRHVPRETVVADA